MAKVRVSEGNDYVIERESREYGSKPVEVLRVDGKTGNLTVAGQPLGTGGGGFKYLLRVIGGGNGPGAHGCPGARVGDVVQDVILYVSSNTPPVQDSVVFGTASSTFESVISVNDQIQQASGSDLTAYSYTIFLERAL